VKEYNQVYFYHKELKNKNIDIIISRIGTYVLNDTLTINVIKKDGKYIPKNNDLCYNNNMLPIRVRSRKNGDKILLDSGHKKVKDLLIDEKIGILKRESVLICEKDDEVLAVIGIKKSIILKNINNKDIIIRVEEKNG
jgi:tRNA(Ile)-lysidine synthetase-like protein